MSDHLCEINDKLLKQSDELEVLKKSSKVSFFVLCVRWQYKPFGREHVRAQ